jgi:hypothetical protein
MMRAALVVLVAGCVGDVQALDEPAPIEPDKPSAGEDDDPVPAMPTTPTGQVRSTGPACLVAPGQAGACALACDPEELVAQFVPEGTCTLFECELVDGTRARFGGCR